MGGWKTWLAGLGLIATGLGMCIAAVLSDPIDGEKLSKGIGMIGMGLGMIGLGHKLEKNGR